jgi:hypothetical protein
MDTTEAEHPDLMRNNKLPISPVLASTWLENEEERGNITIQRINAERNRPPGSHIPHWEERETGVL